MSLPIFPLLVINNIRAFSSHRGECEPQAQYSGYNVCHYIGDDPGHYRACRAALAHHFGVSADRLIIPRQTHSVNVMTLTSLPVSPTEPENIDAIVTNLPDTIIGVNTADCVPVVIADPVAQVIGIAHAGWRGAVGGIVGKTIQSMIALGSIPANIHAVMGPSICQECFEVGEEVACQFDESCVSRTPGQKPHVSLQKHIVISLIQCGLQPSNIQPFDTGLCTLCHPDRYWSARKMGINSGRLYTFAFIGDKIR